MGFEFNINQCHRCEYLVAIKDDAGCAKSNKNPVGKLAESGGCPIGRHNKNGIVATNANLNGLECISETYGPNDAADSNWHALWANLHLWALSYYPKNVSEWLAKFGQRIPCGDCRRHWLLHIDLIPPPDGSDRIELFRWTVKAHNQVSDHLKKPSMTFDAALAKWDKYRIPLIGKFFDAVFCLNLPDDRGRWSDLKDNLAKAKWPFADAIQFPAIYGDTVGIPTYFGQGGGAWGCLQTHRRILETALMAGHRRILVLEDDAEFKDDFAESATTFLSSVINEPWDCLMFGGQHHATPLPFKPGVVRCTNAQRTHAMALSRNFMRELYKHWSGPLNQHCDWALGPFSAKFNTFAPEKFIVGQRGGYSRIKGEVKPSEWWN